MKVIMKNFGCYENKTFKFSDNFILFSGQNGTGKSTVFKAICYALYGKCKNVKYGTTSCRVDVKIDDFIVSRTSKPVRLTYTCEGIEYQDDKAQGMIENRMGMTWQQFYICTWITKSSIVTMTPMERYNVVRTMISSMTETTIDAEKIITLQKELQNEKIGLEREKTTYENVKSNFKEVKCPEIIEIPKDLELQISSLEKDCEITMNKEEIEKCIRDLENKDGFIKKIQKYRLWLIYMKKQEMYKYNASQFEKQKMQYFTRIQDETKDLQEKLKDVDFSQLKILMSEENTRNFQRSKFNPYWDYSVEQIQSLLVDCQESSLKTTKQECPHCKEIVCISDNTIKKYKSRYDNLDFSISDKQCLESLKDLQNDYVSIEKKYNSLVANKLKLQENLRILEKSILSPELVRLSKSIDVKVDEPEGFVDKYTIDELQEYIDDYAQKIGGVSTQYSIKELKNMLTRPNVQESRKKLQELYVLRGKASEIEQWKIFSEKVKVIDSTLEKIYTNLEEINNKVEAIAILRVKQKESEILSLQTTIDSINTLAKEYLHRFFNNTMDVSISMYNKNNTKMSLEMKCEYNGVMYSDVDNFSQGETIKINLAFIFAMNRLVNSKFLLLDEVLSNIDKDIIGDIYEILQEYSVEKPVYVIDHNAVEGIFGKVVEF